MKAFVTGASGLIGSNVVCELERHGWTVRALFRPSSSTLALSTARAERVIGDVLEAPAELARKVSGCEVLFHAAAQFAYAGVTPEQLTTTAVQGTAGVLEAAALAGVRRVVVTSSSVVFGSSNEPSVRDEHSAIGSVGADGFVEPPYAAAKVEQDRIATELGRSLGLEVVFACPTMTLGRQATALGPSNGAILAYLADPWHVTYPGGCNFVSARDVAVGHRLLALNGVAGEHYLLGSENLTWPQIHALVSELCGVRPPQLQLNHSAAYLAATLEEVRASFSGRPAFTTREQARMVGRYYWYSHAKAEALGFRPAAARTTLARLCAWLVGSSHVSRQLRAQLALHADVHAARAALKAESQQ